MLTKAYASVAMSGAAQAVDKNVSWEMIYIGLAIGLSCLAVSAFLLWKNRYELREWLERRKAGK